MRTLVIDTATPACSVALIVDGAVVAAEHLEVGRGHAERLILMIAALPNGGRADLILIGCGPGSFTGVRVGIAAGRALALGWDADVRGFSTLSLIAAAAFRDLPDAEAIDVVMDGGHGELFVQSFTNAPLTVVSAVCSLPPAEAARMCEAQLIVGSAAGKLIEARGYGTAIQAVARASDAILLPPELTSLAPSPIYGRLPDAKPAALAS